MSEGLRLIDVKFGSHIEISHLEDLRRFGLTIEAIRGEVECVNSMGSKPYDVYHIIVRCSDKEQERIDIIHPTFVPPMIERLLLEQYLKGGEVG